jgi:hypothetical protein
MVAITLNSGESISVALADTDGEFQIHYDTAEYPKQLVVKECAGLPGSVKGGANEVMYHEDWRSFKPPVDEAEEQLVDAQHHGWFCDAQGEVRHTDLVKCLVRELPGGERLVITLDHHGLESGEFTFYESLAELDSTIGIDRVLNVL